MKGNYTERALFFYVLCLALCPFFFMRNFPPRIASFIVWELQPLTPRFARSTLSNDPSSSSAVIDEEVTRSGSSVLDFSGRERYLEYAPSSDFCNGVSHYDWSFMCALGDAMYSNRTFVLNTQRCIWGIHRSGDITDNVLTDLRLYYNYEDLLKSVKFVLRKDFDTAKSAWQQKHGPIGMMTADEYVDSAALATSSAVIVKRKMRDPDDDFWYKVCEAPANIGKLVRPYHLIGKNSDLTHIAEQMAAVMGNDYDAVHVRRGDKVMPAWPHLDADTRPPKLVATLKDELKVLPGRQLYIATNEKEAGFFDPLKGIWKVNVLDDFSYLWAENSLWYNRSGQLQRELGLPVEFDVYMRALVDDNILRLATRRIETFNDLTEDPKGGIDPPEVTADTDPEPEPEPKPASTKEQKMEDPQPEPKPASTEEQKSENREPEPKPASAEEHKSEGSQSEPKRVLMAEQEVEDRDEPTSTEEQNMEDPEPEPKPVSVEEAKSELPEQESEGEVTNSLITWVAGEPGHEMEPQWFLKPQDDE